MAFVGGPIALVALILGASGRGRHASGRTTRGRGAANAAMVLGIAGLVLSAIGLFATLLFLGGYWES